MPGMSRSAYVYATILYAVMAAYFWYAAHSVWLFLAQNYFPQAVSNPLSLQNAYFSALHISVSAAFALVMTGALVFYRKLREFVLDVGEELSRVSWPTFAVARHSTGIVLALVLAVGFFLFFVDRIFSEVVSVLLNFTG